MTLRKPLRLLPKEVLVKTGRVDHADWNYRPLLGFVQTQRFRLCRRLLGSFTSGRLLEVGYGSGVFLPELGTYARQLFGVDVHPFGGVVAAALNTQSVSAYLVRASAEALPFADGSFDTLVAVSTLEFVPDLARGCAEMHRVLKRSGSLIVITPGASPIIDFGFKILTGEDAKRDFGESRQRVRASLEQHFLVEEELRFPPLCPRPLCLYRALRLRPRGRIVPATNVLPSEEEAGRDEQHSVASVCEQEVEE